MGSLDVEIMRFVAAHRTAALTAVAQAVEGAGDSAVVLVLLALVAFGVVAVLRAWRVGAAAVLALVAATLAAQVLKRLVERPRPRAFALLPLDGWAMPSTHAARTAAVSLAVVAAATWSASAARRRQVLVAALVVANVLVGVFMVYLGAHWPTDVLAGWALGAVVGFAVGRLLRGRSPAVVT